MANKRKTTTKAVTNRSMRKIKPANDITEIKRPSPEPSLIPIPMLRNSFQTTPPLNSSRLPIMLENSFEDIISEGLQLVEWTKVTKKNPKKNENPQPKPTLSSALCLPYRQPNLPKSFTK